ncbi:DUF262 domain-containing protein [Arthrobacter psychrochitiniphilus]|uniref:DUF262 domain-containing protein n=1 Tax=Arthrobacter psychrochitiniphilus TaxID=291045 RepID=UPI003F7B3FFE
MQQPSKATATDLFEGRKHYVIPAYQRPYVWNEEDQWAPLWDDIQRVAESYLIDASKPINSHFLGAVVFELLQAGSAGITEFEVIDGQQRLTTLQVLLDAVQSVLHEGGHAEEAERLEELILNRQSAYQGTAHRFKLWPSQANRSEFVHAMDPTEPSPGEPGQIKGAHDFFRGEANRWIAGLPDDDDEVPPGTAAERAAQLANTLVSRLVVVAIDLSGDDDAQLIFETLNDRGTPLLKADLIKNWVFRHGQRIGANVEKWARTIWEDFDTEWWREEITQGRLIRSRVDIFLQYWLIMRLSDEVKAELAFRTFVDYAAPLMETPGSAETFLTELRADADTYRGFGKLDTQTVAGKFRIRIIETMELAATTPLFLWAISPNHALPEDQVKIGLAALESWVVRRTLLQMTSKDLNKLIVAILKSLASVEPEQGGTEIRRFLSQQTANTREWPNDERFISEVSSKRLYGYIKQNRIAVVLRAVEEYKRGQDSKYGETPLPTTMSIEHVMPQKWREHWRPEPPLTNEQEQQRDRMVHTLGNLTLIPQSLNSSLSNRPWADVEAGDLSHGGQPGRGKWNILSQFNLQVLNKEILKHQDGWAEENIANRSVELAQVIAKIWPGPDETYDA